MQNEFLETKNITSKKPFNSTKKIPSFTINRGKIKCNDQISPNFCILSKIEKQLDQSSPSCEIFSKEKKMLQ